MPSIFMSREDEVGPMFKSTAEASAEESIAATVGHISEGKPLVLLRVNCRVVPVYNKTDVSGLQTFLRNKFVVWASNGSNVEEIWNNFKNIAYKSTEYVVPHKTLRKNSDTGYYNKEIK